MSRKNNVNPDYYKTAGRDRPNEDVPGAPPVGERPESDEADGH